MLAKLAQMSGTGEDLEQVEIYFPGGRTRILDQYSLHICRVHGMFQ